MNKTIIFIQAEGKPGVTEAEIMIQALVRDLHETFKSHGIDFDKELEAFVDEADTPLPHDAKATVDRLKHGSRVHVTRCKKIKVTVHYMHRTIDRAFAPGTRAHRQAVGRARAQAQSHGCRRARAAALQHYDAAADRRRAGGAGQRPELRRLLRPRSRKAHRGLTR
jgi:hypothetical protein